MNNSSPLTNNSTAITPTTPTAAATSSASFCAFSLSGFPSPHWQIVTSANEVQGFPVIAKAISGGYDGRGVWKVSDTKELAALLQQTPKLLIEELVDFDYEIAVMVARSPHGQATTWTPTQTIQEDGICTMTISPAPHLSVALSEKAQKLALDGSAAVAVVVSCLRTCTLRRQ